MKDKDREATFELCCVVWKNPSRLDHPQARLLQTLTSHGTPPRVLAIPRDELTLQNATYVASEDDFMKNLNSSTAEAPLIIPTHLVTDLLGWEDFQFTHYAR